MPTKLEELQGRRNELAGEIKALAKKFEDGGNQWSSASDRSKWDRVNADYDKTVDEMDAARNGGVLERAKLINQLQSDPVRGMNRIGREDTHNSRVLLNRDDRPEFVNAATGEPLTVLRSGQRFADVLNVPREFAGGPTPDVCEVIASKMLGRPVGGVSEDQYQASLVGNDSTGGFSVAPTLVPQILDMLRPASIVFRAGAAQMVMPSSEVRVLRWTKDPVANWRHEGEPIPASTGEMDVLTMRARTVAAIATITLETAEDAPNFVAALRRALMTAMGQAIDNAALAGSGEGAEPLGLLNDPAINTVDSVGAPASYGHVSDAIGKILAANYDGAVSDLAWIQNPRDAVTLDKLVDQEGRPLAPTPWASQLQRYHSTKLPIDQADKSVAVIGDFTNLLVGQLGGIRFQAFDAGNVENEDGDQISLVSTYRRALRIVMRLDVANLRPQLFTKLTGIEEPQ